MRVRRLGVPLEQPVLVQLLEPADDDEPPLGHHRVLGALGEHGRGARFGTEHDVQVEVAFVGREHVLDGEPLELVHEPPLLAIKEIERGELAVLEAGGEVVEGGAGLAGFRHEGSGRGTTPPHRAGAGWEDRAGRPARRGPPPST